MNTRKINSANPIKMFAALGTAGHLDRSVPMFKHGKSGRRDPKSKAYRKDAQKVMAYANKVAKTMEVKLPPMKVMISYEL